MKRAVAIAALVALPLVAHGDGEEMKCNAGDADACTSHGSLLWQADRKQEALRLWQRGCDLHSAFACWQLGTYLKDDDAVRDLKRSAAAFGRSCAVVDTTDCAGDCDKACVGTFATCIDGCDAQQGDGYYTCSATCSSAQQSCGGACLSHCSSKQPLKPMDAMGYAGCNALGTMYAEGKGVRKDPERAKRLHALWQTWQDQQVAAGEAREQENMRKHPEYYRGAEAKCRAGAPDQCHAAAMFYTTTDPERSVELLTIMMRAKPESWALVAMWADKMARLGKRDFATSSIDDMCSDGIFNACAILGMRYEAGTAWPKDLRRAEEYYDRGCKGGD